MLRCNDTRHPARRRRSGPLGRTLRWRHQMRLVMVGSGYVGLVSGVCFADFGHDVVCVDKDPAKIAKLKAGEVPIFEPGLDTLLHANIRSGRLSFTTDLTEAA